MAGKPGRQLKKKTTQWQQALAEHRIFEDSAAAVGHESLAAAECRLLADSVAALRHRSLVATECKVLKNPAAFERHSSLEAAECMVGTGRFFELRPWQD